MPIRFRRTIKVAPGVKLNLSKSGVSTTVGSKGFHLNFGKRGIRRTVTIPGTGISEVDYIKKNKDESEEEKEEKREERREARLEENRQEDESQASEERSHSRGRRRQDAASARPTELRNVFVLLGIVVFFFAGATVLGLIPAHFFSNSLQYLAHLMRSTGH